MSCVVPVCAQEDKFSWASVNLKESADRSLRGAGLEVLTLFTKISLPLLAAVVRSSVCLCSMLTTGLTPLAVHIPARVFPGTHVYFTANPLSANTSDAGAVCLH